MIYEIIRLNNFLDEHLNIEKLKKEHNDDILYKITITSLLKYKWNFAISPEKIDVPWFDAYLKNIVLYLKKIYSKEKLEWKDILELHSLIMKNLVLEKIDKSQIWVWRNTAMKIRWYNLKNICAIYPASSPKYVEKNMNTEIQKLNIILLGNTTKEEKLIWIISFIIESFKIHPFANGNGKVFWILLDLLFWKYDFFPVFVSDKRLKDKVMEEVFAYRDLETKNENILIDRFLIFLSFVYSHYSF